MSPSRFRQVELEHGTILRVACAAGIDVPLDREKVPIACPFHEDNHPSAVLFATNTFFCSSCGLRLIARDFAARLGVAWRGRVLAEDRATRHAPPIANTIAGKAVPTFSADDSRTVWNAALEFRTRGNRDRAVDAYLRSRKVDEALDLEVCSALPSGIPLPGSISTWANRGYRLVAPLYDAAGEVVAIQARAISNRDPKTLFPKGSHVAGTVFANARGLELLRNKQLDDRVVIYGEGLTDSIAYALASPFPSLCSPGTSMYVAGIGSWARGRTVILAADADRSGDDVIPAANAAAHRYGAINVIRLRWKQPAKDACDVLGSEGIDKLRAILACADRRLR